MTIWMTFWKTPLTSKDLMCESCHFDRASNDEFSVECLFWFFQPIWKADVKVVQIIKNDLFWVSAPLKYLECVPNCKTWPLLKKMIITNIWHSTPISAFNALSKWHEPDIIMNIVYQMPTTNFEFGIYPHFFTIFVWFLYAMR